MPKQSALARPEGRAAKFAGQAEQSWSEHLDLIAHRIPESDVERTLCAAGLHRLIGGSAKPLTALSKQLHWWCFRHM